MSDLPQIPASISEASTHYWQGNIQYGGSLRTDDVNELLEDEPLNKWIPPNDSYKRQKLNPGEVDGGGGGGGSGGSGGTRPAPPPSTPDPGFKAVNPFRPDYKPPDKPSENGNTVYKSPQHKGACIIL